MTYKLKGTLSLVWTSCPAESPSAPLAMPAPLTGSLCILSGLLYLLLLVFEAPNISLICLLVQILITRNAQFYSHLLSQISVIFCYGKNFQFPIPNWTLFVHHFTGDTLLSTFYFSYLCACLTALNFMFYCCHFSLSVLLHHGFQIWIYFNLSPGHLNYILIKFSLRGHGCDFFKALEYLRPSFLLTSIWQENHRKANEN